MEESSRIHCKKNQVSFYWITRTLSTISYKRNQEIFKNIKQSWVRWNGSSPFKQIFLKSHIYLFQNLILQLERTIFTILFRHFYHLFFILYSLNTWRHFVVASNISVISWRIKAFISSGWLWLRTKGVLQIFSGEVNKKGVDLMSQPATRCHHVDEAPREKFFPIYHRYTFRRKWYGLTHFPLADRY